MVGIRRGAEGGTAEVGMTAVEGGMTAKVEEGGMTAAGRKAVEGGMGEACKMGCDAEAAVAAAVASVVDDAKAVDTKAVDTKAVVASPVAPRRQVARGGLSCCPLALPLPWPQSTSPSPLAACSRSCSSSR